MHSDGIENVVSSALNYIGTSTPIFLSYDIDALDPSVAPSTGLAAKGGLTLEQGKYISQRAHDTGNLVGMDLVNASQERLIFFGLSIPG